MPLLVDSHEPKYPCVVWRSQFERRSFARNASTGRTPQALVLNPRNYSAKRLSQFSMPLERRVICARSGIPAGTEVGCRVGSLRVANKSTIRPAQKRCADRCDVVGCRPHERVHSAPEVIPIDDRVATPGLHLLVLFRDCSRGRRIVGYCPHLRHPGWCTGNCSA